jgi:hypothetical protein
MIIRLPGLKAEVSTEGLLDAYVLFRTKRRTVVEFGGPDLKMLNMEYMNHNGEFEDWTSGNRGDAQAALQAVLWTWTAGTRAGALRPELSWTNQNGKLVVERNMRLGYKPMCYRE